MKIKLLPMRVALAVVVVAMAFRVCVAQAPRDAATPATVAAPTLSAAVPVSTRLQPALNAVHETVDSVRVDKWKRGNIRDEAAKNISQIQRDIDVTLPPMLRDADTAPASLSKLLPISRNISALYDVLLRVVEASRVVASDDQVEQLQKALVTLGNARLEFSDRMQTLADTMEKQLADLRATAQSQADKIASTATPIAVPCTPAPKTTPKKAAAHKPAAKPSGTKPATPASGTQTKPSSGGQQNNPQQNTPPQSAH